jgi:hypothetical protein
MSVRAIMLEKMTLKPLKEAANFLFVKNRATFQRPADDFAGDFA